MITQREHDTGDALSAYSSGRNGNDLKHTVLVTHDRASRLGSQWGHPSCSRLSGATVAREVKRVHMWLWSCWEMKGEELRGRRSAFFFFFFSLSASVTTCSLSALAVHTGSRRVQFVFLKRKSSPKNNISGIICSPPCRWTEVAGDLKKTTLGLNGSIQLTKCNPSLRKPLRCQISLKQHYLNHFLSWNLNKLSSLKVLAGTQSDVGAQAWPHDEAVNYILWIHSVILGIPEIWVPPDELCGAILYNSSIV